VVYATLNKHSAQSTGLSAVTLLTLTYMLLNALYCTYSPLGASRQGDHSSIGRSVWALLVAMAVQLGSYLSALATACAAQRGAQQLQQLRERTGEQPLLIPQEQMA